jgi:hypothetical protein
LRQPIQHIVRVVCSSSGVGLRLPVPNLIVGVGKRIDRRRSELMPQGQQLRRRVVGETPKSKDQRHQT